MSTTQLNSSNDNLVLKSSGQITGSTVLFTGGKIASFDLTSDALKSSTNSFFISSSATDDDFFISSSKFNVKASGNVTASQFLLEGGRITSDVTIEGSLSANSISTPAGGSPLAEITDQGFARFVSASIAGFTVNTSRIKSADGTLQLGSDGLLFTDSSL